MARARRSRAGRASDIRSPRFAGTRRSRGRRRTSSASASTTSATRRRAAQARGSESEDPDRARDLHEGADDGHAGPFDDVAVDRVVDAAGGLGGRARRRHRQDAARTSPRADALESRLRLHGHQRRQRARPAAAAHAVVQGQEPRRLLPDGSARRHRRRVRRSADTSGCSCA